MSIKSVIEEASAMQRVREFLDAYSYGGALGALLTAVERHLEAIEAVRRIDTSNHRWARQGGAANQPDRDKWQDALAARDAAEEHLRAVLAARDGK